MQNFFPAGVDAPHHSHDVDTIELISRPGRRSDCI